jgi:hypothetical protein
LTHINVVRSQKWRRLAMLDETAMPDDRSGPGLPSGYQHLSKALDELAVSIRTERVALETINQFLGRRSIGALLLILALPMWLPIPAPGISVAFGVPLILVSAQLLVGRRFAWLPRWLARRSITRRELRTLIAKARPTLRTLERVVRPRLSWLAADWAMFPVGGICLVLSLVITLPIPLGHMVPGAAISFLALGLIERDGLAVGVGLITATLGLAIVALASTGLIVAVRALLPP